MKAPKDASEAYRAIVEYFSLPGAVLAKTDTGDCCYRDEKGNACAVGCLIPDEIYARFNETDITGFPGFQVNNLEGRAIHSILGLDSDLDEIVNGDSEEGKMKLKFLADAQHLHDSIAVSAKHFLQLLEEAAYKANLNI